MKRPKILITNDDGIYAPGIRHLWNSLKEFADITIVAPIVEQSGVGLSLTWRNPLHIEKFLWPEATAWSVSGTPADCVKMALSTILDHTPDLVVSGINRGSNAGRNVLYSGTVAGVIEGVVQNVPGIAFSCCDFFNPNYATAEKFIPSIVKHILDHPLPVGTLLNVNFPEKDKIKGLKLTSQGKEYWAENPEKRSHPAHAFHYYWLGAKLAQFEEETDSDIHWLAQGYATAVPVHVGDLTDRQHLKKNKDIFEQINIV